MNDAALEANVLTLNRLYLAIHIISAKRAFCLLCKGLAEVVDLQEGHQYRTRGSRKAYTMSTSRFMMMMASAPMSTVPCTIGRSLFWIAS